MPMIAALSKKYFVCLCFSCPERRAPTDLFLIINVCLSSGGKLPTKVIQPRCKLPLCAKIDIVNSISVGSPSKKQKATTTKTALFLFGSFYCLVMYEYIVTQVQITEEIRPILKWKSIFVFIA